MRRYSNYLLFLYLITNSSTVILHDRRKTGCTVSVAMQGYNLIILCYYFMGTIQLQKSYR